MPISDFHMRVINGAFNVIGNFISTSISGASDEKLEDSVDKYYEKASAIIKKYGDQGEEPVVETTKETHIVKTSKPDESIEVDLSEKKISEGTACLPCSRDHFTQASALLEEATRFASRGSEGLKNPEVRDRMHAALKELNAMERWDLRSENIANLTGKEKELATWALNKSADIRHTLTSAKTPDDLIKVSAEMSGASKNMMSEVLDMMMDEGDEMSDDDVINKLCGNLSGDAKQQCIDGVSPVLPGA